MFVLVLGAASSGGPLTANPISIPIWLEIANKCAPIMSALVAITAVIFVSYQIVLIRRSNQTTAFLKLFEIAHNQEFAQAANFVKYELDPDISYSAARANQQTWGYISQVIHFFESIGILVQRNYICDELLFDQMGTWIAGTWSKVKPFIATHRATKG